MKQFLSLAFLLSASSFFAQGTKKLEFNKEYKNVSFEAADSLEYSLPLEKDQLYDVSVLQQGVDVIVSICEETGKTILDKDSPNGKNGYEKFEYTPSEKKNYLLKIKKFPDEKNTSQSETITIYIKKYTATEIKLKETIKKELAPENKKNVQTIDIDHFWEAFDGLKKCKSHTDSVNCIQKLYLDRATNGLMDFIKVRNFSAEKFVRIIAKRPKFYASVRKNTLEAKKAAPLIEDVFKKFKELYPNFQPFKVCFAVGMVNTGGTVSENFVLIGSEVSMCTKSVDLSEFNNDPFSKVLAYDEDIIQKIKNIVAHECVHTQQNTPLDSNAIVCTQLYNVLQEGFCDFIGELVTGGQINKIVQDYGDKHEAEIWNEFKAEMCKDDAGNWLYNFSKVKDKPADLGYYIGYKIAAEYYKNAVDKKQAVIDIIEMKNPLRFLELSRYDQKEKK